MQIITITFSTALNCSIQPGDFMYWTPTTTVANSGFNTATGPDLLGTVQSVSEVVVGLSISSIVTVMYDETVIGCSSGCLPLPAANDYFMFEKDARVNSSGLVGYYASVEFENWSTQKVELFSIGSEINASSK
jgi:hypothetical protein